MKKVEVSRILSFLLFFIFILAPSVYGYLFIDEFNYSDVDDMRNAGWQVSDENYISFTNYSIILHNDCSRTTWPRLHFSKNFSSIYWVAQSLGRWLSGSYGSLHIIVLTSNGEYSWWGDGYSEKFIFSINGNEVITKKGYLPSKNEWYEFRLVRKGDHILGFFNNSLIFSISLPLESIMGIGVNSAWCSEIEYDKVSFFIQDFKISSPLNKTYFTTSSYMNIPLNLSIYSLNETFYLQIFIDNNLFLDQTFYGETKINKELNQSIGSHCISINTNASNVENQTICYTIVRVLEKPLFITDKD